MSLLSRAPGLGTADALRTSLSRQESAAHLPSGIAEVTHRPWPIPSRPWSVAMHWHDLLFMHWPVRADLVRPLIPRSLTLETYDDTPWIGVVPFRMTGVRPRLVPRVPGLSAFCELNVRTYVTLGGKRGVWFFSLDAASRLAVRSARWRFHLPYYYAVMSLRSRQGRRVYRSARRHRGATPARFAGSYWPVGEPEAMPEGSFGHWVSERYCLYAVDERERLWRGEIHHPPWRLQPAEAEIEANTMTEPLGVALPSSPPILHFAHRLDVVAWSLERVSVSE